MLSFITKQRLGIGLLTLMLAFLPASAAGPDGRRHNLYMVSVGQTYTDKGQKLTKLPCCEKDAIDMFRWAESQKGKLFDQVHARKMVDGEAKSKDILDALRGLKDKVKTGDYVIVYLSGHGGVGKDNRFEFCAYDGNLGWSEIQAALRDVRGTVIVILDACHSGGVNSGDNLIVLSASLRDQCSLGGADKDHNSLYTQFLLEALNGQADMNRDGFISLAEVDAYVSGKLASAKVSPCTLVRPANIPSMLPLAKLGAAQAGNPPAPAPQNLAGTTWNGSEAFNGGGKLSFRFQAGGKAVMIDAQGTAHGTYKANGNEVVIQLPGVALYRGTINGATLTGQGRADNGTWQFTVTKQ
jgi:hypothetical protein